MDTIKLYWNAHFAYGTVLYIHVPASNNYLYENRKSENLIYRFGEIITLLV